MSSLTVCCIWLCCIAALNAQQQQFSLSASPSDMKVDSGEWVFLAAGNQLLRLNSTLTLQENVTLGSSVLRVVLSSDERRVVVCLSDLSCVVYNASDFGAGEELRRTGASVSSDVIALFTARENSFYIGSVVGGATASMNLGQYGFGNEPPPQSILSSYKALKLHRLEQVEISQARNTLNPLTSLGLPSAIK